MEDLQQLLDFADKEAHIVKLILGTGKLEEWGKLGKIDLTTCAELNDTICLEQNPIPKVVHILNRHFSGKSHEVIGIKGPTEGADFLIVLRK